MQRNKLLSNLALATTIQFFIVVTAFANTIQIDAAKSGWLRDNGETNKNSGTENYIAGYTGSSDGLKYFNYFVFDLAGIEGEISSATLKLENPDNGFYSFDNDYFGINEEYNYYVTNLNGNDYASYLLSNSGWDYGTNIQVVNKIRYSTTDRYGDISIGESSNGTILEIELNQLAINEINTLVSTGENSLFALGGNLETVNSRENRVFAHTSASDGPFTRTLNIEYGNVSTVPLPPSGLLLLAGLMTLVGSSYKKRAG